jgi:Fe-Mn family superoxide dismutase
METLKLEFLATGEAMFGPGFVWLVKSTGVGGGSKFRIYSTYLAGTPYSGAHYRRQPVDMNSQPQLYTGDVADIISRGVAQNDVGAMGKNSRIGKEIEPRLAPGGVDLTPALCVSTWENAWLQDWGFGGKRAFLEAWWDKVNWEIVMMNSNIFGR